MNYRHAFHAGNHGDVFKHVVLARILSYLARKAKPYRMIDTHAGIGVYDLGAEEAVRSPEWREGIARVMAADTPADIATLIAPYLDAVAAVNPPGKLLFYPGSPAIARHMMRDDDRLVGVELHDADHDALSAEFAGDRRVKVMKLDGWLALGAQVPPRERRGLVLVDPPYEETADWQRLVDGLARAHARWPTGIYALWYPVTAAGTEAVDTLDSRLAATGIPRITRAELRVRSPEEGGPRRLGSCPRQSALRAGRRARPPPAVACRHPGAGRWNVQPARGDRGMSVSALTQAAETAWAC